MSRAILSIDRLDMRFGGVQALSALSFDILKAGITSLIGPNGAGKTTAINCLSGVYRPQKGKAFFEDKDITGQSACDIARLGLTRTFQNLQVFADMTVLENVMLGLHTTSKGGFISSMFRLPGFTAQEKKIREKALGMTRRIGLSDKALIPAGALSYGDQKRVEMARALVSRPRLVFLDEPAAGLNPQETELLAEFIVSIKKEGVSILLVEHDMDLVMEISDQVVVLNYGRKIAQGPPEAVQSHPDVIQAYLGED